MKKMIKILLFLIFAVVLSSCKDENVNNPTNSAPEVPPVATMQMDFENFPNSVVLPKTDENLFVDTNGTKNNWGFAYLSGVFWHTFVKVGMAIPVTAFAESFNHEAIQQDDGRWTWTYEFIPLGGVKHTATLFADVDNFGVTWEMYITKDGFFNDFLWFSGESDLFATEGTWTIYNDPTNLSPWIGIEWHRNPDNNTADIKYTNILEGDDEYGGYIFYGKTADAIYNAFYEIFNKGKDNTTSVKWNLTTHEGQVKDSLYFGDSNWHCWDSNLDDIDCP